MILSRAAGFEWTNLIHQNKRVLSLKNQVSMSDSVMVLGGVRSKFSSLIPTGELLAMGMQNEERKKTTSGNHFRKIHFVLTCVFFF